MAQIISDSVPPSELPSPPRPAPVRARTSGPHQGFVAFLIVCAVLVILDAGRMVFDLTFVFFGEHPSPREEAIVGQACVLAVWASVSMAAAGVARAGRGALALSASIWTAALIATRPWWWPRPPSASYGDYGAVPMWLDGTSRPLVWGLVLAGLAFGVSSAWQYGFTARVVAGVMAASILAFLAVCDLTLQDARQAEAPSTPLATVAALGAAGAEPFWSELPSKPGTTIERELGTSASWREDEPSVIEWRGPADDPLVLLEDIVDVAERTGWSVASATCDANPSVNMTKDVGSEPTTLMVGVAHDHGGLVIRMRVGQPDRYLGDTIERC